ncbi:PadR family transcriptional regulator [Gemmatimonadota bacterium]
MGNTSILGEFEQLILLAILRISGETHTAAIRQEIMDQIGRKVSRGAVYTTLDRLENKGLLSSVMGEPRPVRSGRARRYYAVEPDGLEALNEAREVMEKMWTGLEPLIMRPEPGGIE